MAVLDLRPSRIKAIEFKKGSTLKPIFFLYYPTYTAGEVTGYVTFNLTGYTARMKARPDMDSDVVLLDLNTTNNGLSIIQGTAEMPNYTLLPNCWGVQMYVSDEDTALIDWDEAIFDIEIESPVGEVISIVEGMLKPEPEATR
jgi:hypothetical protein